jgi:hypothetical protein
MSTLESCDILIDELIDAARRSLGETFQAVVGIEALYLDLREPQASDRLRHVGYAVELAAALRREFAGSIRPHLTAFINDISHADAVCDSGSSDDDSICNATCDWRSSLDEAVASQIHSAGGQGEHVQVFYMKTTMNRATKVLKRALRDKANREVDIEERMEGGQIVNLVAPGEGHDIILASRSVSSPVYVPRCTAIMAQHYHDVFAYLGDAHPQPRDVWMIDFNRFSESGRVRSGAEAARVVFDWPKSRSVRIANCVFDEASGKPFHIQWTRVA